MSDEEGFVSRWSRRKQAAAAEAQRAKDAPALDRSAAPEQLAAPERSAPPAEEPEFDVSTLPSIDQITAITDVRDFLRAGVPAELTRAALRRAWSADPAIRDFVGLAENAWDFTAPDTIPGFGPLDASPEEIRRLVDRIVGGVKDAAEAAAEPSEELPQNSAQSSAQPQIGQDPPVQPVAEEAAGAGVATSEGRVDIATQYHPDDTNEQRPRPRRSHGSALPQ